MLLREERLDGVHPDLAAVVRKAALIAPYDIFVLEGLRTREKQEQLVKSGASQTLDSRHLTGHAVDLAPNLDTDGDGDDEPSWHWGHYDRLAPVVKQAAAELGIEIEWGGDWKSFRDGPHWQLPKRTYH
jgi:peptidoglycan L-alanyl-D-glutamate endopeptidase CwlK